MFSYASTASEPIARHLDHNVESYTAALNDLTEAPDWVTPENTGYCCHTCSLVLIESANPTPPPTFKANKEVFDSLFDLVRAALLASHNEGFASGKYINDYHTDTAVLRAKLDEAHAAQDAAASALWRALYNLPTR